MEWEGRVILLDTNIFISSMFGRFSARIVDLWLAGSFTLGLSRPILEEYDYTFRRMPLVGPERRDEWFRLFQAGVHCRLAESTPTLPLCKDPTDDKFIEAAVALSAAAVVTSDKLLLAVREHAGIPMVRPSDFLERSTPARSGD